MGCYLFSVVIIGPYPISWFEYGLYPHQLVWKWIWIWALPHRLVWIWALPHQLVWIWALPHRLVWIRALSPSVVCLKGFTPIVFWFISRDVTPNKECRVFVLRCRATSFSDLPNLVSAVLLLYYPMSFIHVHSFMHMQHAYKYHSCMVALSVLFLIVQKVSSIMCLSQKCYQSCIFQVAGPTKTVVYQCLFISPVKSPFLSRHFSEIKAIWLAFDSLFCFTTEHLILGEKGEKSSKHPFKKDFGFGDYRHKGC